jgi:amidohydrolase
VRTGDVPDGEHAELTAAITGTVDALYPRLTALSHAVHARPELAFAEHHAARLVADELIAAGFTVQHGSAGLETALVARAGDGPLRLAIFAEYDALPEIGHACGHNIIAAAAVGAGAALAPLADRLGITVEVYGTPAEESGGGKVLMLRAGVFDGVGAAGMVHPAPFDVVRCKTLALADLSIEYTGVPAHASAAPFAGRNAGDAATVTQVALGLLRQHLEPGQQLHGIVARGGTAPNIVPDSSELLYYLRAETAESLDRLSARAGDCFAAGALATGCTVAVREVAPVYTELVSDEFLASAYRRAITDLGREPVPARYEAQYPLGSTDMGNVSRVIPSIHPLIGLDSAGAVTHQPGFAAAAVSESADRAVRDGAIALAVALAAGAVDPIQRQRLLDGAAERAGSSPAAARSPGDGRSE